MMTVKQDKQNILIITDMSKSSVISKIARLEERFFVDTAPDPSEAKVKLSGKYYSVVIVDGMIGPAAVRQTVDTLHTNWQNTGILVLVPPAFPLSVDEMHECGADLCLEKPLKESDFLSGVTAVFEKRLLIIGKNLVERKMDSKKTELKDLQENLLHTSKLALMGELIGGIVHDLNNPLTTVLGFTEELEDEVEDEEKKEIISIVHSEADRCRRIVHNLLTLVRKKKAEEEILNINDMLADVLRIRQNQLRVENIKLSTNFDPEMPKVYGYRDRLQQVFFNLIINAEQALKEKGGTEGKIAVTTKTEGEIVRIEFCDTGPGISEEHIKKLFEPYFTTKEKGTGMGLFLCSRIIDEMKGKISVSSEKEKGTCFVLELPRYQQKKKNKKEEVCTVTKVKGDELKGVKLLVVDDETNILKFYETLLKKYGCEVTTATNANDAVKLVKEKKFDVIVTDCRMPGAEGQTFHERVGEIAPEMKKRIIFSTGDTLNSKVVNFARKHHNKLILKPFRIEEIVVAIKEVLHSG